MAFLLEMPIRYTPIRAPEATIRLSGGALSSNRMGLCVICQREEGIARFDLMVLARGPTTDESALSVSGLLLDFVWSESSMAKNVIVKDPAILGGTPVFRDTRVPFQALLDYLEGGQKLDDFLEDFPTVSREAAIAALEEAKALVVARLE
jgi:uncharacterized protein (DUF433 family)